MQIVACRPFISPTQTLFNVKVKQMKMLAAKKEKEERERKDKEEKEQKP
jgi:hypothetical protein